jgi:nucleoside-triphosphatase
MSKITKILLTGEPKAGKSFMLSKLIDELTKQKINICGMISNELQFDGLRVAITLQNIVTGTEKIMAIKMFDVNKYNSKTSKKLASYQIDTKVIDEISIPALKGLGCCDVLIIDEIGKMELFSKKFEKEVAKIFSSKNSYVVIAIVPIATDVPFVEKLKNRSDVELITLTRVNRKKTYTTLKNKILKLTNKDS